MCLFIVTSQMCVYVNKLIYVVKAMQICTMLSTFRSPNRGHGRPLPIGLLPMTFSVYRHNPGLPAQW